MCDLFVTTWHYRVKRFLWHHNSLLPCICWNEIASQFCNSCKHFQTYLRCFQTLCFQTFRDSSFCLITDELFCRPLRHFQNISLWIIKPREQCWSIIFGNVGKLGTQETDCRLTSKNFLANGCDAFVLLNSSFDDSFLLNEFLICLPVDCKYI